MVILENPEVLAGGLQILLKLLNKYHCNLTVSIALNPLDDKYRHFKLSNKTLQAKLYSVAKMDDLLRSLGFIRVY